MEIAFITYSLTMGRSFEPVDTPFKETSATGHTGHNLTITVPPGGLCVTSNRILIMLIRGARQCVLKFILISQESRVGAFGCLLSSPALDE